MLQSRLEVLLDTRRVFEVLFQNVATRLTAIDKEIAGLGVTLQDPFSGVPLGTSRSDRR